MTAHIKTDPICHKHQPPTNWLTRWRFDRNRGRICWPCRLHLRYGDAALRSAQRWGFSSPDWAWRP